MRIPLIETPTEKQRSSGTVAVKRSDSSLFWWSILITVLLAFATFCWFFTIFVFSQPEKPFNYRVLSKLDKLPTIKDFSDLNVPTGKFYAPKDLYQQFFGYNRTHLSVRNDLLKRHYLNNYKEERPIYVRGTFQIDGVRSLSSDDIFTAGMVIRGQSVDYPNVSLEYILPGENVPSESYKPGDVFELTGSGNFASIIHVERLAEEQIHLTALSITYPTLEVGEVKLTLSAPERLNLEGTWPLMGGVPVVAVPAVADVSSPNSAQNIE